MRTMGYKELIKIFENDIMCDNHGVITHGIIIEIERSNAQKELVRRSKESLRPIIDHLSKNLTENKYLHLSWCVLLFYINYVIDSKKLASCGMEDLRGWVEWAKKIAK